MTPKCYISGVKLEPVEVARGKNWCERFSQISLLSFSFLGLEDSFTPAGPRSAPPLGWKAMNEKASAITIIRVPMIAFFCILAGFYKSDEVSRKNVTVKVDVCLRDARQMLTGSGFLPTKCRKRGAKYAGQRWFFAATRNTLLCTIRIYTESQWVTGPLWYFPDRECP